MTPPRADAPHVLRASLAVATSAATVALVYAGLRAWQALFHDEPNPAMIIWSARAAMFWRLLIGAYAAFPAGVGAWAASERRPDATARFVARFALVAGAAILAQGLLVP